MAKGGDGDEISFDTGPMAKGISVQTSDFQPTFTLDWDSYNLTQGIYQGLGPRYGMGTLPGHMGQAALTGNNYPTLQLAEAAAIPAGLGGGYNKRLRVLACYPITLPPSDDATAAVTTYAFILDTTEQVATPALDIVLTATKTLDAPGNTVELISSDIRNGFGYASTGTDAHVATNAGWPFSELIVSTNGQRLMNLQDFLLMGDDSKWYASSVFAAVSGGDIPMQWLFGNNTSTGDATHAPDSEFGANAEITSIGGSLLYGGVPSEYQMQNFKTAQRAIKVYALTANAVRNMDYSVTIVPSPTVFFPTLTYYNLANPNLVLSSFTATKDTAGTVYAATKGVLINDDSCIVNSSYKVVMMAQKKAYMCLFQDGFQGYRTGKFNQWVDPTQLSFDPPTISSAYDEDGIPTKTCFIQWPQFLTGSAMASPAGEPAITGANTGVLRANTTYEFTYSLYNKRINVETNVGKQVKFTTGTADFVGLSLYTPSVAGQTLYGDVKAGTINPFVPYFFSFDIDPLTGYQGASLPINFYEYRFYYRQLGSSSWLPALTIDAANLWFNPGLDNTTYAVLACTNPIAGTTGGEPGAFNDYSPLPSDAWIDVKVFKNRAFWISSKQIIFSLANNFFAYPGRNSVASPSGDFLGALVHAYPGQANQNARIVVFSTESTYAGRFSGQTAQANVQVSANSSGVFDVDGSDFVLDAWTSFTAFSYRAAAIAEGVLYYWGPKGIIRDDGVNLPGKISGDLEPTIISIYEPSVVDQIFAQYNTNTKEVIWFYTPSEKNSDAYPTHMIIYNTVSGNFTRGKSAYQIDWSQDLNVSTSLNTGGKRTIVGTRTAFNGTLQRAYFFDQLQRSGDMAPGFDIAVESWTTPSPGQRRLSLVAGTNKPNLVPITVGSLIALQNVKDYATSITRCDDMIASVVAINSTTGTIDIALPAGAVMDATAVLAVKTYFPIWNSVQNSINWKLKSCYWMPEGPRGFFYWNYLYILAKLRLWASDIPLSFDMNHRSPTSTATTDDIITLTNNSDGNCQIYKRLSLGADAMEGNALRYIFSGVHIGHEWLIQFIETRNTRISGEVLFQFMK